MPPASYWDTIDPSPDPPPADPPEGAAKKRRPAGGHDHRPPPSRPDAPVIRVLSGLRHAAADAGLRAMVTAAIPIYQRDPHLVRVAAMKAKTSDGAVIEVAGVLAVTTAMLGRYLGQSAEWERVKASGEAIRIDPPKEVVEQIASMSGEWPFPPIVGVVSTPTMRPDGTILSVAGYDEATGLVLVSPPPMPAIPDCPTRLDADRALDTLQGLLVEFPFADDASRSVALSMILTTVLRGALLPAVPMHVATAPQPGTGKSYLLDIASAIATGERCAVIALASNPEEAEKRLIAAALAGRQIIALDNISEMLSGDFLNQVTERPILRIRPLGTSKDVVMANAFTVFANGNNLSAPADLVRRTIVCRLDANIENPEEREFTSNPVQAVLANRGTFVAACLTIGRAYVVAGRPNPCRPLPSFERWSGLVRSALVWLGCPDPCASMDLARAEDPLRAARAAFFATWAAEVLQNPTGFSTPQIVEQTENRDEHGFLCPTFREAALSVAGDRPGHSVSPFRLGKWLNKNKNNVVGGLKLVTNLQDPTRPRWLLKRE
jgi:putative DNA primase/helicase